MSKPTHANLIAASIEVTGDPVAPLILQEAYTALNRLGKLMPQAGAKPEKVEALTSSLLDAWSESEIEEIASTPDFIMSVAAILSISLKSWIADVERKRQ